MASIWEAKSERVYEVRPTLPHDIETEALIIGGGLAGVLTAYMLTQAGVSCVLVEGRRLGSGATGNTTAKVTAQHGLLYDQLIKSKGLDRARMYYDANQAAVEGLRGLAASIPCDFEEKTAYVYAQGSTESLERELAAYEQLDIPYETQEKASIPVANKGALGMQGQAQFNPLKLLYGLAQNLTIFENTLVTNVVNNTAETDYGSITARSIVFASHYPFVNVRGRFFMKLHQERSYCIALDHAPAVDGMYIGDSGGYSFRTYGDYVVLGGGSHRTGQGPKPDQGYNKLRSFTEEVYPQATERYAWATQDCMSLDKVPYLGNHRLQNPNWYVATGFNKWGMTGAYVAARVITDLIVQGCTETGDLFSPQRSMIKPSLFSHAGVTAVNLIKPGRRCSHMGCYLAHNEVENSWDCPCHGSRFGAQGDVLDGPATKPISEHS